MKVPTKTLSRMRHVIEELQGQRRHLVELLFENKVCPPALYCPKTGEIEVCEMCIRARPETIILKTR